MQPSKNRWLDLAILAVAQFMIVLDVSIVNVALPSMQKTLGLTIANLQGIVTAYTLAFGGFLLLGGRTADLYGRKRVFLAGITCFTLVSLTIGIVDSGVLLVPLRALQGLAAAFMSPAALSLVLSIFTDQKERNRALSVWGAVSAGGATAGLLVGGILTEYLNWRWNFFVNVPVGIAVLAAGYYLLPTHTKEDHNKSLDLPGAILATGGLMLLVYTLSHANAWGWLSLETLGFIVLSVAVLAGFIYNESRAKHPLMPLSIFKIGNIAAANAMQMPMVAGMFSMFFFLSIYVQNVLGYSPLRTGLAFLPVSLLIGTVATLAPLAIRKVGYKPILVVAPLFLAIGLYIFTFTTVTSSYWDILPGLLIVPFGLGLSFVAITISATAGVPASESGLASGLLTTAQQIGGSLGLAILSSIASSVSAAALLTYNTQPVVAVVAGFHGAFYAGMGFALLASLIALVFIKPIEATHAPAPSTH